MTRRASRPPREPTPGPLARWMTCTRTRTRTRGGSPRSTPRPNASWRARRSVACARARQSARRKPRRRSSSPPSTSSTSTPPPGRTRRADCFASGRRRGMRRIREARNHLRQEEEEREEEETCSWRRTAQSPRVLPGTPAWTRTSTSPSARCASPRVARRSPRSRRCLRCSPLTARTGKKTSTFFADKNDASPGKTRKRFSAKRPSLQSLSRSRRASRAWRRASWRAWTRFESRFCSTTPTTSPIPKMSRFRRGASRTRARSPCARS